MGPGTSADRARAINNFSRKRVDGSELGWTFFDPPTDGQNVDFADGSVQFISWAGAATQ